MSSSVHEQWNAQMLEDWKSIRPMVISSATRMNQQREIEDVMQDVFLIANKKLDKFDAERGSFRAWLMGIAYNRLRQKVDDTSVDLRAMETLKGQAQHQHLLNNDPYGESMETGVIMRVDFALRLSEVMSLVAVVEDPTLFARSMALLRTYDGNVQKASEAMGISAAALRDSHRQVLDMAKAIDNALKLHHERAEQADKSPLTVRELLSCFPDPDESEQDRQWLRRVPLAVFRAGGWNMPQRELVLEVSRQTGYSVVTSRHAVARCFRLFMVVRTVAETGTLS